MVAALIDGPILHAAFTGLSGVNDSWIDELVRVILVGCLPAARAPELTVVPRGTEKLHQREEFARS